MGMLELVVRSRLGRDGLIRTSSSLVTHMGNRIPIKVGIVQW